MAERYKLTYFNGRGLAEPIRLIFAFAEVPYEDKRIEKDQWPDQKTNYPWGKLPVLHVGDETLCQSKAICRFLANKYNLGGEDYWEAAKMDEASDSLTDIQAEWSVIFWEKDEAKKSRLQQEFLKNTVPKYFDKFESQIKENGGVFLIGKKYSWVDFHMAHFIDSFERVQPGYLERFPTLTKAKQTLFNNPQIKAWIEKRPVTEF